MSDTTTSRRCRCGNGDTGDSGRCSVCTALYGPVAEAEGPTTNLGAMLHLYRTVHRYGQRAVARETGLSHATICRIERGGKMDLDTWLRLQAWLLAKSGGTSPAAIVIPKDTLKAGDKFRLSFSGSIAPSRATVRRVGRSRQ